MAEYLTTKCARLSSSTIKFVMDAAHDYEDMHHLIDRLPLTQVRRLRLLAKSDSELSAFIDDNEEEEIPAFFGSFEGSPDLAEHSQQIIRTEFPPK